MVVKSAIVAKIAECVHNSQIAEISDVRDESDRHGMRIVVEIKKDCDPQIALNKLLQLYASGIDFCHRQYRPCEQQA